jgi:hypothetical protein
MCSKDKRSSLFLKSLNAAAIVLVHRSMLFFFEMTRQKKFLTQIFFNQKMQLSSVEKFLKGEWTFLRAFKGRGTLLDFHLIISS